MDAVQNTDFWRNQIQSDRQSTFDNTYFPTGSLVHRGERKRSISVLEINIDRQFYMALYWSVQSVCYICCCSLFQVG